MNLGIEKNKNIEKALKNIIGKRAWGVRLGHGSFITIEFGKPKPAEDPKSVSVYGEWHFWVYLCSWRLERKGLLWVGCEDKRLKIETVIKEIENKRLLDFDVYFPSLDAILKFESGIELKLFSIISEDVEGGGQHWMLFMPGEKVLVAGPGSYLEVESEK